MHKLLSKLFLAAAIFQFNFATATIHKVTVSDGSFTPASFTAVVGDTVEWNALSTNTMDHTTTSTTKIPAGAASWDSPMTLAVPMFRYVITEPGTYDYVCTPHSSFMTGTFTATPITALKDVAAKPFNFFPNPASDHIVFSSNTKSVHLTIYDLSGKKMKTWANTKSTDSKLNIAELPNGLYFLSINVDGKIHNEKLIIAH